VERRHRADLAGWAIRARRDDHDEARGQDTVELRIAEVVEDERFVDEAEVAGTVVRTTHRIDRLGKGRVRIVYRLEADGPAAAQIGPAVSADFPETIAALVEHATR
jgi:hypothetical protein